MNWESSDETIDGCVDHNQDINTNETNGEKSETNESQRENHLNPKSDNNCETNTSKRKVNSYRYEDNDSETGEYSCGSSDEEMSDNSDFDSPKGVIKREQN